jgi:methylenetetrahydrofolate reductase (NADPH)
MTSQVAVSFEFFPPNDDAMGKQLWEAVSRLAPLQPKFVSVTYGADGSTRARKPMNACSACCARPTCAWRRI